MILNPATPDFLTRLARTVPAGIIRPVEPRYLEEPRGLWRGQGGAVLMPETVDQVAAVVRACGAERVGIVPYGGGTGLVGGQVMAAGPVPVILSLERMTRIRQVHPRENVLIAEAGAILADVQAAAAAQDRLFPLSLASEGSCRIGGNLATNAGGVNVLRYGNARELCLGLEAVMPDGTIWNGLRRLRKDNTGYDLRGALIGAEGSLGIITAASLRLFPRPATHGTAMLVVPSPAAALDLLALAGDHVGPVLSAFELIGRAGLEFLAETFPDLRQPFAERPEWMVLIDLGTGTGDDPQAMLERLFVAAHEAGLVSDGVVAQSTAQRQELWALRETIPLANRKIGAILSNDIALPLGQIADFIAAAEAALTAVADLRINCFGHLGDGNLHYNLFAAPGRDRAEYMVLKPRLEQIVNDLVAEVGGSFSAEHGVGRAKVAVLERYGDPARLAAMRAMKRALDPLGIMNPGAVLR